MWCITIGCERNTKDPVKLHAGDLKYNISGAKIRYTARWGPILRQEQTICAPLTVSQHQPLNAVHTVAIQVLGVKTLLKADSLWGITLETIILYSLPENYSFEYYVMLLWWIFCWKTTILFIFGEDALENELYPAGVDITLENKLLNELLAWSSLCTVHRGSCIFWQRSPHPNTRYSPPHIHLPKFVNTLKFKFRVFVLAVTVF